uniref:NADH dehydrogenase subunit 3 n=1 Tax=Stephanitis pyrioides TaxID=369450 RepID=UPI002E7994D6|nr:NADH dehydrogenase subunit 3 [Stephanitis pyrioides]WQM87492.1 NADH dehydrogenase subunit 3 [Stephanitis pyrioides]
MFKMMMIVALASMISMLLILLNQIINKKMNMERNKMTPFECGFDPKSSSRIPFSTQFFLIGILFLIFDVEMVMILPLIVTFKTSNLMMWTLSVTTMIVILIIGLYYEWKNGVIQWMY